MWREGRTILLLNKGDRNTVTSWCPMPIVKCFYFMFTCPMAQYLHEVNTRSSILSDGQTGSIKKMNRRVKHGIIISRSFHGERWQRKNLGVRTTNFTNAFRSAPPELIALTIMQPNFPEWIWTIIANRYSRVMSIFELKTNRSDRIGWKTGVKQARPSVRCYLISVS
jgi:hypothetical protein